MEIKPDNISECLELLYAVSHTIQQYVNKELEASTTKKRQDCELFAVEEHLEAIYDLLDEYQDV